MKKNISLLTAILSGSIIFSVLYINNTKKVSDEIPNKKISSNLEIITPDYITNGDKESTETFATIYVYDMDSDSISDKKVKVEKITSNCILEKLKSENIISSKTTVNNFDIFKDDKDEVVGILDLSKEFYDFNLGSGFESMMLDSIAKTYIENFDLDKFKILVNNEEYGSGHISIEKDEYFTKNSI